MFRCVQKNEQRDQILEGCGGPQYIFKDSLTVDSLTLEDRMQNQWFNFFYKATMLKQDTYRRYRGNAILCACLPKDSGIEFYSNST